MQELVEVGHLWEFVIESRALPRIPNGLLGLLRSLGLDACGRAWVRGAQPTRWSELMMFDQHPFKMNPDQSIR